jgi:hypothetical protein
MRVKLSLACDERGGGSAATPETWTFAADAHMPFDIRDSCDIDISTIIFIYSLQDAYRTVSACRCDAFMIQG